MNSSPDIVVRILGPFEVCRGSQFVDLGSLKQRVVLAMLVCAANSIVPTERLMDALWSDDPPRTATKNLQVYLSQLRKILFPGRGGLLSHHTFGYRISLEPSQLDVSDFERMAREGRLALRAGNDERAAAMLRSALDLWRGPALADLQSVPRVQAEAARLEERRISTYEDWFDAELALGHTTDVLDEVDRLVDSYPLRERLRSQQMTALYQSGRQSEALAVFDEIRQALARELGLTPSPALQRLYQTILSAAPEPDASIGHGQPVRVYAGAVNAHMSLLPRDVDDFTGRVDQLESLVRMLGGRQAEPGHGLAVLHGPPGAGKTTLAVHTAHRLAAAFPDGQLLVRLRDSAGRPREPREVQVELLRVLGIPRVTAVTLQQDREALLSGWLVRHRVLLVLDDAPDEAHVRPLLPGVGDSAVLITSRRLLGGLASARFLEVGALSAPEAVELLVRIIGEQRALAEPDAVERVARACGLFPLALRIAGIRLVGRRQMSLTEFADRLCDPRCQLDELSVCDLAVRTAVETAYRDLLADERAMFARLGALPGPCFAATDLAAMEGDPPQRLERLVERLIQAHFVTEVAPDKRTPHAARYRIPELFWLYAQELATMECSVASPSIAAE
jgi:DNA-binding SARP family transcriptional activator